MQEVIEGLPVQEPRSNIDRLIEALAQRQNIDADGDLGANDREDNPGEQPIRQIASPRGSRPGLRRAGDVEGVRQSSGNWQRDNTTPWNKPILARPMNQATRETQFNSLYVVDPLIIFYERRRGRFYVTIIFTRIFCISSRAMADMELENWRREMRSRPQPALNAAAVQDSIGNKVANRKRNRGARHGYRTRAARDEERDDEEFEVFEVVLFYPTLSYFI